MMKFLIFNHQLDSKHSLVKRLIAVGVDVRLAKTADEAWQVLAELGKDLDLAIIHREGVTNPDVGVEFIKKVKADPVQSDLPMVMTSGIWNDFDFARHQRAQDGVNGYLKSPFKDAQIVEMAEAILGQKIADVTKTVGAAPAAPHSSAGESAQEALPLADAEAIDISGGIALEPTAELLFQKSTNIGSPQTASIRLNGPDLKKSNTAQTRYVASESRFSKERREFKLDDSSNPDLAGLSEATKGNSAGKVEGLEPTSFFEQAPNIEAEIPADLKASSDPASQENSLPTELVERPAPTTEVERKPAKTLAELDVDVLPIEGIDGGSEPDVAVDHSFGSAKTDSPSGQILENEVPYLFSGLDQGVSPKQDSIARAKALLGGGSTAVSGLGSMGDLVVPGGASQSPDAETLKKYLLLREQDVSVLASQLKSMRDQNQALENQFRLESSRAETLQKELEQVQERIKNFEKEKEEATLELRTQLSDAQFQLKIRAEKAERLEQNVRGAADEMEKLKERVRNDLRKIRAREKELENKLEILKRDTDALLSSRESSIIELKRKIDLLEFNMDLLQDQYFREKDQSGKLKDKLERAAQAVKLAEGLLDRQEAS